MQPPEKNIEGEKESKIDEDQEAKMEFTKAVNEKAKQDEEV